MKRPQEADRQGKPDDGAKDESALERTIWVAAYVVILLTLAAGAARRLIAIF